MSVECGLPNEFCFMDLRKGVKVIGYITGVLSLIFSIQLLVYLFSDFNEIKNEISDKNEEVIEKLDGTQGRKELRIRINGWKNFKTSFHFTYSYSSSCRCIIGNFYSLFHRIGICCKGLGFSKFFFSIFLW